ncbi:Predicted nucleotidyltransferases [uncultured Eubacterium sp.]|nr:Predicted nucleotidyltransferases [uncultured Eubacterium sp.]
MKCKLEDIVDVTMGQSPKSEFYNKERKGYPFLQGNRTFGFKYPTFNTYTTVLTKLAKTGDIIMSVRAPVGDLNITPVDMCLGRGVCSLRMKNGNQSFLFYLMKYYVPHLLKKESGTVFGSVNRNDINGLEVDIPADTQTQKKIARYLEMIDDKIEINNAINNNLEQQAQALYQQMFIDNASSDWAKGTLNDIADITMGQSPSGSSYNEDGNGTIFFQGRAEFGFRFPSIRLYTTEPKRMAYANDALMSVRAPVGDLNVAHTNCCIGRGLAAIHSKSNHQSFVLYTMFSLKKQLDVFNGEGTVFGSINRNSLNDMPILIPSNDAMDDFENLVAPMDTTIRNNYDEICRLRDIRDSLLPRLMSGELDVSEIDR